MGYLNLVGVGDSLEYLKQIPDNSIDAIVTDPPYGLGKPPPPLDVLKAWTKGEDYQAKGAGFMGNTWDVFVPGPPIWRECCRILKPGGWLVAFFGTRTYDWGTLAIRLGGFDVLDQLEWIYGSGFPKGQDIGKQIDKHLGVFDQREVVGEKNAGLDKAGHGQNYLTACGRNENGLIDITTAASEEAQAWEGWNTCLKPAHEPICLARKPMIGKYCENVLEHGTGALNIDACRLGTTDALGGGAEKAQAHRTQEGWNRPWQEDPEALERHAATVRANVEKAETLGRYPNNVILGHLEECKQVGTKEVRRDLKDARAKHTEQPTVKFGGMGGSVSLGTVQETVEDWDCAEGCPVRTIGEQSGKSVSKPQKGDAGQLNTNQNSGVSVRMKRVGSQLNDSSTAARFFYTAKAVSRNRWAYCKKCQVVINHTAKAEFDAHLKDHPDEVLSHPTQKPIKLMEYLVKLVTQKGGVVLDPFCGTGTTAVAAKRLGRSFVTCELSPDYAKIASARVGTVGVEAVKQLQQGSYFCPGCRARGEIKLIAKKAVDRMQESGKKTTCMKCMKRFSYEDLVA
jgi:DNA modification methylase